MSSDSNRRLLRRVSATRLSVIEVLALVSMLVVLALFAYLAWALGGPADDNVCDVFCGPGNFTVTVIGLLLFPILWFVAVGIDIGAFLFKKWLVASVCSVLLVVMAVVLAVSAIRSQ